MVKPLALWHLFVLGLLFSSSLMGFEGFYVGGSTGPSTTIVKQEGRTRSIVIPFGFTIDSFKDLDTRIFDGKWDGTLFAGYGCRFCDFYAGLEAFFRYSRNDFNIRRRSEILFPGSGFEDFVNLTKTKVKMGGTHYGLDSRFGFFLNPLTLIYGRVGVEGTSLELIHESSFSLEDFLLSATRKKRNHLANLRLGVGLEECLFQNLTARVDYIYTRYGSHHLESSAIAGSASLNNSTRLRLHDHSLSLGLAYYFCGLNCSECFCGCFPNFSRFYVGGALGGSLLDVELRGNPNATVITPNFVGLGIEPLNSGIHLQDTTFTLSFYTGYGCEWKRIYAGLEAFFKVAPLSEKREDATHYFFPDSFGIGIRLDDFLETEVRIKPYQVGVDFRPGIFITPKTLLYGKIGTSYADLEFRSVASTLFTNVTASFEDTNISFPLSKRKQVATLRAGIGLECALSCLWHIRAEYLYTNYGSTTIKGFTTLTVEDAIATFTQDSRLRVRSHDVTLGLSRYF